MDSDISSEHAQQLLEDRVKFKLYAAEQHLNELKNIKQKHGSIRKSPEILVKAEMEIDCFLAHIMGARDPLLVEINNELGLMMPLEDVKLETVNARLDDIIKRDLLKDLNHLISNNTSWLWFLNEIRNHSDMSRRAARVNVGLALPYIKNSIIDAIDKAREIGNCKETDYAPIPDIDPANIKLRKD